MNAPFSAEPIVEARLRGMRPADMVILSMVGRVDATNPVVFVNHGKYSFRWLRGLDVVIYTNKLCKWQEVAMAVAECQPRNLWLWDVENKQGADVYRLPTEASIKRGPERYVWMLDFLPWLPFQNEAFDK